MGRRDIRDHRPASARLSGGSRSSGGGSTKAPRERARTSEPRERPQTARESRQCRGSEAAARGHTTGASGYGSGDFGAHGRRGFDDVSRSGTPSYATSSGSYPRSSEMSSRQWVNEDCSAASTMSGQASSYHSSLANEYFEVNGTPRPYMLGFTFKRRPDNGYGRNALGGFALREVLPPHKHPDLHYAFRAVHPEVRPFAEPNQPGPGFRRTETGNYWRR